MLIVAFVSFSLFNFVGDPINNMVGEETSDQERAELRETLGMMDPIHVQFSIQAVMKMTYLIPMNRIDSCE